MLKNFNNTFQNTSPPHFEVCEKLERKKKIKKMIKMKKKTTDVEDFIIDKILNGNIIYGRSNVKNSWMCNPMKDKKRFTII